MDLKRMAWAPDLTSEKKEVKLFVNSDRGWVPWSVHPACRGIKNFDKLHSDGWAAYLKLRELGYAVVNKKEMGFL